MKKSIVLLFSLVLLCQSICALPVRVILGVAYDDDSPIVPRPTKGPVHVPELSIEDYTLTFSTPCYGWTLTLVDENDDVAYTTIITSDSLVLPSTLSGDYQLRLIPNDGNIYFYGYVLF